MSPSSEGGRVTAVNWLHLARWLKRTSRERGGPSFVRSTFWFCVVAVLRLVLLTHFPTLLTYIRHTHPCTLLTTDFHTPFLFCSDLSVIKTLISLVLAHVFPRHLSEPLSGVRDIQPSQLLSHKTQILMEFTEACLSVRQGRVNIP